VISLTGFAVVIALLAIAALHAYWGLGGVWPGHDERSCARAIAGFRGIERMPSAAASFAVTAALLVVATVAAAFAGFVILRVAGWAVAAAGAGAAIVFLGRGIAGFTPAWRRLTPEQPFATYDVRYYSPLCLAIGAAIAFLVFWGQPA
jgi:hypothetical protein